jgi:hypothetical protein
LGRRFIPPRLANLIFSLTIIHHHHHHLITTSSILRQVIVNSLSFGICTEVVLRSRQSTKTSNPSPSQVQVKPRSNPSQVESESNPSQVEARSRKIKSNPSQDGTDVFQARESRFYDVLTKTLRRTDFVRAGIGQVYQCTEASRHQDPAESKSGAGGLPQDREGFFGVCGEFARGLLSLEV